MLANSKIRTKLITIFLLIGLIPVGIIGLANLYSSKSALQKKAFNQLVSLRDARKAQIEAYQGKRLADVSGLATDPTIREAMNAFDRAFDMGPKSKRYQSVDKKYSAWLTQYEKENGYYDFLLISAIGDVLYTVGKRADFATDIIEGEFSGENISELFALVDSTGLAMVDFAPYTPSDSAPAAFVGAPVKDSDGYLIGIVALQLPMDRIAKLEHANRNYYQEGISFLELSQKALSLYVNQKTDEQADQLRKLVSNCTIKDVTLSPTYRSPFDLLLDTPKSEIWRRR